MKKTLLSLLFPVLAFAVNAQTQNALDFDGIDDRVTVADASSLLVGGSGISLSTWFYPRNPSPNTSSFDGLAGFRNENDFDFYLLHYTATTLEGRLRFGPLEYYNLEGGAVQLNAWNHAALVFDGATLSMYVNGDLAGSVAAAGTVTNATTVFQIGNVTYQLQEFLLDGRADEVSLWKRALNEAEIQCLIGGPADLGDPDLVLYFTCDQGIAGGDNTAITSLTDAVGNINGSFVGLAMTGSGSNFVDGASFGTSFNANVCPGGTYDYNGQDLTAGSYTFTFTGQAGCDSIVTVTVNEIPVNTNVFQNGITLTSTNGGAAWQWLDCNNGYAEIPGATFQSFTAQANGSYAVEVTSNGCTDTSTCYTVSSIGLEELFPELNARLSPTATTGPLVLTLGGSTGRVAIEVADINGRVVMREVTLQRSLALDVSHLAPGCYAMFLTNSNGRQVLRFARE